MPPVAAGAPPRVDHARIVRLALPMTLANLSTPLLGFADAAVIGRLGEASLLGAIAAAAVLFDFIFWIFAFLRMGTAGLTAQALGAEDIVEQKAVLWRALVLGTIIGLVVIAMQKPIAAIGFHFLDASPTVTNAARLYFDWRVWSAPFVFANYAILGALTGRGRTGVALAIQVVVNLVNIVLNIGLVYGLSLGVRGSAIATLAAEATGCLLGLVVMWRLVDPSGLDRRILFARAPFTRMLAVNRDIMIRTAALIFVFFFFTAQGARGGDIVLAANAVLMNLFLITAYFLDGFATAAEQMCGQSLGASAGTAFRRSVLLTSLWSLGFAAGASILAFLGGRLFIDFVSTNEAVRSFAHTFLPLAALTPLAGALAFQMDGVFIGATWTRDMRNLMLLSLAVYLGCFFALRGLGNAGLWIALIVFLLTRGLTQLWRYRTLAASIFPAAQSAAAMPVTSSSR